MLTYADVTCDEGLTLRPYDIQVFKLSCFTGTTVQILTQKVALGTVYFPRGVSTQGVHKHCRMLTYADVC